MLEEHHDQLKAIVDRLISKATLERPELEALLGPAPVDESGPV